MFFLVENYLLKTSFFLPPLDYRSIYGRTNLAIITF